MRSEPLWEGLSSTRFPQLSARSHEAASAETITPDFYASYNHHAGNFKKKPGMTFWRDSKTQSSGPVTVTSPGVRETQATA